MEEESLSGQAVASVPLLYLLFFSLHFHSHSLMKLHPQAHLWAACPFLEKQTPRAPVSSFSPPFLTCCLKFFHLLHHLLFMQSYVCLSVPLFLPRVPPLNRLWWEWQAPLVGEQRCALWLALECCYDSNRKSPLCSSPHSHQCCSSQRVSLAWLHTQQHQGSSNPPGRRQLSCNGSCTFPPPARLPHCSVCWLRAKKNLHWEKLSGSLNFA